jgi:hypothetical protein
MVFLKFDPLTVTGMALCVDLGPKCQNLFCLVETKQNRVQLSLRLGGIEFSLVSDSAESSFASSQTERNSIV